jgi:hypothetical protein
MNPFMAGFLDELSKHGSFKSIVHHPATQAIGYAALAGEGAHLLAEMGKLGPRAKRFATKTRVGRGVGVGALAGGTAFLASEALAALGDAFGRKRKKKKGKFQGDVIIKVQPPDPKIPRVRIGKVPKMRAAGLRRLTRAIGFKR